VSESQLPGTLVSTHGWLSTWEDPTVRVVDIRGYVHTTDLGEGRQHADYVAARDEYEAGHIPARSTSIGRRTSRTRRTPSRCRLRRPRASRRRWKTEGSGDETEVVIVDHTGGNFATRLWWALKYYGHDRAAVLDGGVPQVGGRGAAALHEAAGCYERLASRPERGPELLVDVEGMQTAIGSSGEQILDARDAGQYSGAVARGSRGGRIPSALHVRPSPCERGRHVETGR
jgi:thiosulfate/3-mercaptopyruvate sulfurtransferase